MLERHYSGTYPAAKLRLGLWDLDAQPPTDQRGSPALVGVAVLSVPTSRATLTNVFPHLEPYTESLELGRFVLADEVPGNGETWLLAELRRIAGGRRLLTTCD
ncbi:hypothetical protein [Nonomuraea dietziae]|uniref:Mom family adenine methylcarbamoylation protein n=1 Tax=Nonomuraea dietziae TaxID=65515 RepID=UPI00343E8DA3